METHYHEVQKFRQPWIWIIILGAVLFNTYAIVTQIMLDIPFGQRPAPDGILIGFWALFGIGLPSVFYFLKLTTTVKHDGLYVSFFPFKQRRIAFGEIQTCETRTYSPIKEYGGWGYRIGRHGVAYNVRGNKGVQLSLSNDKRILIGSQRSEELTKAVKMQLED